MPAEEMGDRRLPQAPGVATRTVLIVVLGCLTFVGLGMTGLFFYFRWMVPERLEAVTSDFPEPTLQISPKADLARFRQEQQKTLDGYAWVDRDQGIARIPIGEAMRLVARRGAEAYEPFGMPAETPSPVRTSSDGGQR